MNRDHPFEEPEPYKAKPLDWLLAVLLFLAIGGLLLIWGIER